MKKTLAFLMAGAMAAAALVGCSAKNDTRTQAQLRPTPLLLPLPLLTATGITSPARVR